MFTDRGIFRPGETVHARTIIRQADFTAPQPFPVVFQIIKPDGRMFKEMTAMPNAFGAAEIETDHAGIPAHRALYDPGARPQSQRGHGTTTFLLEDFVPPQIRVAVNTDPERVAAKETMKAEYPRRASVRRARRRTEGNVKCIYTPVRIRSQTMAGLSVRPRTSNYCGMTEAPIHSP